MGYQEIDLETWPRKEHYLHFTKQAKCFVSITKDVDVTQPARRIQAGLSA